ncbi:Propane 2-monooxygenase operon transcriptional activator MimR [Trichinella pseudospiralis]
MDREHTPTEENLAKEIMKKLDVCKMRLAFMSECLAELCESETISRNGGRVIDRRRTVGQDANLERVLQEVRCSSTRDYRENPSGDSPIKTNRSSQLGVVDCTSQEHDELSKVMELLRNSWDEELDGGSAVLYREVEFYPGGMRILDSSHGTSSRVAYESLPPTEWQSTESCHLYRAGHPLVLVIVFGRPIRRGRRRSFDVYFKCLEADHVAQKCPEKDGCGEPHHTQAKESIEFASARTNSDPATSCC